MLYLDGCNFKTFQFEQRCRLRVLPHAQFSAILEQKKISFQTCSLSLATFNRHHFDPKSFVELEDISRMKLSDVFSDRPRFS
jgi:hypothetical protein